VFYSDFRSISKQRKEVEVTQVVQLDWLASLVESLVLLSDLLLSSADFSVVDLKLLCCTVLYSNYRQYYSFARENDHEKSVRKRS
jgi:hypothetical protein